MENPNCRSLRSPRGPGPVAPAGGGEAAPSSQPSRSTGTETQHSSPARLLLPGRDQTLPFPTPSPTIRAAPLFVTDSLSHSDLLPTCMGTFLLRNVQDHAHPCWLKSPLCSFLLLVSFVHPEVTWPVLRWLTHAQGFAHSLSTSELHFQSLPFPPTRLLLQPHRSAVIHGRGGKKERQGHFDYGVDLLESF